MTVSVIIPVHNGEAHLSDALRSVQAQSVAPHETIVVDDGSQDGSAALARNVYPAARVIRQDQAGAARARNRGAEAATGSWLAFLDHDDVWPSDRTAHLLAAAAVHPEAALIVGRFELDVAPGLDVDRRLERANRTHIPFLFPACLIKRSVWQALGGMDPCRERSEDLDLYMRFCDGGHELTKTDAVTLRYRIHGLNRSRSIDLSNAALLETLRAAIMRRRRP